LAVWKLKRRIRENLKFKQIKIWNYYIGRGIRSFLLPKDLGKIKGRSSGQ
jgi:hypothetical protein